MIYEYWFSKVSGIPGAKKKKLREYLGEGQLIYNIEETEIKSMDFLSEKEKNSILCARREKDLEGQWNALQKKGIKFVPFFSKEYPKRLSDITNAPYALYVKGHLPDEGKVSVAIVGARRCTHYGEAFAMEYGEELAAADIQIISGMAKGIDGAGHRGALNRGGKTYAVLGCGADICYPRENAGLYKEIQNVGGIISEYPPGTPPLSSHFPARNRIISGLADCVLVIEAKEKSGSLITVDMALEQGKDVYALPGPATSVLSMGCHRLISQGAGILLSPAELLNELNIQNVKFIQKNDKNQKVLETPLDIVYSCLDLYPKGIQTLIDETKLEPEKVMRCLVGLELKGKVKEITKNQYVIVS